MRETYDNLNRSAAHGLDALYEVAVPPRVGVERTAVASLGERSIDVASALLDRGVMGLVIGESSWKPPNW